MAEKHSDMDSELSGTESSGHRRARQPRRSPEPTGRTVMTNVPCVRGQDDIGLQIIPGSPDGGPLRVPLGKPTVVTCSGKVDAPERLTDMRWWYPNGLLIEQSQNRIEVVTGGEPGQTSLVFSGVQKEDLGQYRCTAMYANTRKLETSFTLSAFVPITFEDAPLDQYAVKGQDYTVRCVVRADPSPSVDWKKDHKPIHMSDHYIQKTDGLLIKNVSDADEGVYTCRVRVISMGKVEEKHIKLEVQEKPQIVVRQEPLEGIEEGNVLMRCEASGKPLPKYEWVNRRGQDLSTFERFVVDKYKGTLRIDGIKREDTGEYICTAENPAGIAEMQTTLQVVTKPVIEEFKNVTTQVERVTQLVCRASGDPAPDIYFHKDSNPEPFGHGVQRDSRISIEQRKERDMTIATLKIDDVLRSDDGLYNCIATNQRIKTERLGHLTVEFPPSFAHTPIKEAWSWEGRPANLTCRAEAIPNATIDWYFTNRPDYQIRGEGEEMIIFGNGPVSNLQIHSTNPNRFGFYTCVATNILGKAEHRIQFKEARKPARVLQAIVHEKTATSITFKFAGPVEDGGLPVQRFVVEYKENVGSPWSEAKRTSWPVDQQLFIVENLESQRQYQFRFAAENAVGIGEFSLERFETMPRKTYPEPPKILGDTQNGYAINPYPDYFELRWQLPADNGEPIDHFEISHIPVSNQSERWVPYGSRVVVIIPKGEPRHIIRQLTPGTFYQVEIRAHNSLGYSEVSSILVRTALPQPGYTTPTTMYNVGSFADASLKMPLLIVIVLVTLLLLLCVIDVVCCKVNHTGITWFLTSKACSKKKRSPPLVTTAKSVHSEKQPLNDVGSEILVKDTRVHMPPTNGKQFNGSHATVSAV